MEQRTRIATTPTYHRRHCWDVSSCFCSNCLRLNSNLVREITLTTDTCYQRLHAAGWSIADTARLVWLVSVNRGTHTLEARGATKAEAWARACHMAEALGLLEE